MQLVLTELLIATEETDLGKLFWGQLVWILDNLLVAPRNSWKVQFQEKLCWCVSGEVKHQKLVSNKLIWAQTSLLNIGPSSKRMKRRLTLERFFFFSLRWNSDSYQSVWCQISCNVMSSLVIAFANDSRPTALDIESSFILRIMDHWHKWRRTCYCYVFMLIKAAGLTLI